MDNYEKFWFTKGDINIVDYKLLNKCSLNVWKNLLKGEDSKNSSSLKKEENSNLKDKDKKRNKDKDKDNSKSKKEMNKQNNSNKESPK